MDDYTYTDHDDKPSTPEEGVVAIVICIILIIVLILLNKK